MESANVCFSYFLFLPDGDTSTNYYFNLGFNYCLFITTYNWLWNMEIVSINKSYFFIVHSAHIHSSVNRSFNSS